MSDTALGLRERKKQQTRQLIAEHGAAAVRRARLRARDGGRDRARRRRRPRQTVFNYFPTKEDLFYWRLEAFEEELLEAVREREPGASVLAAFRGFLLGQRGVLAIKARTATTRRRSSSRRSPA